MTVGEGILMPLFTFELILFLVGKGIVNIDLK